MHPGFHLHRFVLQRLLGTGGSGTVWAALDTSSGERVALKLLHSKESTSVRSRLEREAVALRRVNHPAIVTIAEVFEHEGEPVLVLELLQGETLRAVLLREGQLAPSALALLLIPVIEALSSAVAHSAKGSLLAAEDLAEAVLPWLEGGHAERLRPANGPIPAKKPTKARK